MNNQQLELDKEFKAWREKKGFTGVQKEGEVDQFLAERKNNSVTTEQMEADVKRWINDHPDYYQCEANRERINFFLSVRELPALYDNLTRAYEHLQRSGALTQRPAAVVKPEQPETRPGVFKNGVFTPFDLGTGRGYVKTYGIGQPAPGVSAEDDAVIRKRAESMTAEEFAKACRTSKAFRDKMDES